MRGRATTVEPASLGPVWIAAAVLLVSLVFSAGLMAVAVGSGTYSWVAWVGLLPLFAAIRKLAPRQAMLCGALWGLSFYLFAVLRTDVRCLVGTWPLALLIAAPAGYAYVGALLTCRVGFSPYLLALVLTHIFAGGGMGYAFMIAEVYG